MPAEGRVGLEHAVDLTEGLSPQAFAESGEPDPLRSRHERAAWDASA